MQVTHCNDWGDLKPRLDELRADGDIIFRGQGSSAWPLASRLSRFAANHHLSDAEIRDRERRVIQAFRSHPERESYFKTAKTDIVNCLVALQHYGCPTRLLDWTWSPYVAAYFAAVELTSQASVFAIDLTAYQRKLAERLDLDDYDHGVLRDVPDRVFERLLSAQELWPVPYWPEPMTPRERTQQSILLIERTISVRAQDLLTDFAPECCYRFTLPLTARSGMLEDLKAMNLDGSHLFHGAEGVALGTRDYLFGQRQPGDRIGTIPLGD